MYTDENVNFPINNCSFIVRIVALRNKTRRRLRWRACVDGKINCFWRFERPFTIVFNRRLVAFYLQQPQPLPPPQMQERMRMSHTMSQLPIPPILPPQPQLLRSIKSKMISQQLQPHPFAPFVKNPFILCTSLYIRISPTLPYATFEICVTEALKEGQQNIISRGSIKANDRFDGRIDACPDSVGLMLCVFQYRLKVVDCAQ